MVKAHSECRHGKPTSWAIMVDGFLSGLFVVTTDHHTR